MDSRMDEFRNTLKDWELDLTEEKEAAFLSYYETLVSTNEVMNLTAITEFDEVLKKHFLDSLALSQVIDLNKPLRLLDVGTGAGFPGIPLKIMFENLDVTLLDSLNKRVKFLNETCTMLHLDSIVGVHGRAEEFLKDKNNREQYDLVVSRAVSRLCVLSELTIPALKVGGKFVAYKSGDIDEELEEAKTAIGLLGGNIEKIHRFSLPNSEDKRSFVVISKVKNTPSKYPRRPGIPGKEPLLKR